MTKLCDKAEEEIHKWVNAYPEHWTHSICAFVQINPETGEVDAACAKGHVCHVSILYPVTKDRNDIVVNAHRREWQKLNPDFLLWVARESPFSHGVLNRDNEYELFNHASVLDIGEVGVGGALWLAKAFRHFVEDTWKHAIWIKLREEGLDGLQAFIGADILDSAGRPLILPTHVGLFGYSSPSKLREFYDESRRQKRIDTTMASRIDYPQKKSWGSLESKPVRKPDGWGGYVEILVPASVNEYAAALKEIFEGNPNNVE